MADRKLRKKLVNKVFSTEDGAKLLSILYEEEVLCNKVFSKLGSLARQVGRSDLILDFYVCLECKPERQDLPAFSEIEIGTTDSAVKEHHLKANTDFFKKGDK